MAQIPGQFITFKGLNYPYGIKGAPSAGQGAWRTWLYDEYNLARILTHFQYIKSLGCKVVRIWTWLDNMIDKTIGSPAWGAASWSPSANYNATYKANWEDFLTNCVIAEGMKVIPVLLIPTISPNAYSATFDFETEKGGQGAIPDCLLPTVDGAALVDATTLNGNLADDPFASAWPNGFLKSGTTVATWQAITGSSPIDPTITKEVEIVGGSNKGVFTYLASFNASDPLCQWKVDVKGNGITVFISYYNSSNTLLGSVIGVGQANYADWTTLTFGSIDLGDLGIIGSGAVKFCLAIYVSAGNTSYVSGHRCSYASRNTKWQNYVDLVTNWCTVQYPIGSAYGPAIAAWELMNEQYSALAPYKLHPLLKAIYDAISGAAALPVILDTTSNTPYETVANQGWFDDACDIISAPRYNTAGSINSSLTYNKPWIIGEAGAAISGGAYQSGTLNPPALQNIFDAGWTRGALCVLPWDFCDNPSISTPNTPNRVAPFTDAPAGTVIKQWTAARRFQNGWALRGAKNNI